LFHPSAEAPFWRTVRDAVTLNAQQFWARFDHAPLGRIQMAESVYKVIELIGNKDIPLVWRFVIAPAMKPDRLPRNS
jgi:hypothetical protein